MLERICRRTYVVLYDRESFKEEIDFTLEQKIPRNIV